LIRILNWKAPRVKGIVRLNEFSAYKEGIRAACGAEENENLKILVQLYGIGAPVGSTMLHFIYPSSFPIIDIRTAETLHHAGRIKSKSTDLLHYGPFRSEMLNIAKENIRLSLGGVGALTGVATIISASLIILAWRHYRFRESRELLDSNGHKTITDK
jgi:hypothetical protein